MKNCESCLLRQKLAEEYLIVNEFVEENTLHLHSGIIMVLPEYLFVKSCLSNRKLAVR
jgi:hypothetical protein